MKRYIKSAESNIHTYLIKYGDGNAAASRGTEFENICESTGYLSSDKLAYFAANKINQIWDDEFEDEDVYEVAEEYFGEDYMSELNALSDMEALYEGSDRTGGSPNVYEILKDGKTIFYDEVVEEMLMRDVRRSKGVYRVVEDYADDGSFEDNEWVEEFYNLDEAIEYAKDCANNDTDGFAYAVKQYEDWGDGDGDYGEILWSSLD